MTAGWHELSFGEDHSILFRSSLRITESLIFVSWSWASGGPQQQWWRSFPWTEWGSWDHTPWPGTCREQTVSKHKSFNSLSFSCNMDGIRVGWSIQQKCKVTFKDGNLNFWGWFDSSPQNCGVTLTVSAGKMCWCWLDDRQMEHLFICHHKQNRLK